MFTRLAWLAGFAGAALFGSMVGAPTASAEFITCLPGSTNTDCAVQLEIPNTALSVYAGPYASGNIHWVDAHTVNVSFQSLSETIGSSTYLFRIGDLALNLTHLGDAGVSVTGSNLSFSGNTQATSFTFDTVPPNQFQNVFGDFNVLADDQNGFNRSVTSISFTLTLAGAAWANAMEVLELNDQNHSAAGHIYVGLCGATCATTTDARVSGVASWPRERDDILVPEPLTMAMFATGLLGLGALRRRRSAANEHA